VSTGNSSSKLPNLCEVMTTVQCFDGRFPLTTLKSDQHDADIIEEKRKDGDGRVFSNKFLKGQLLGKVNINKKNVIILTSLFDIREDLQNVT
jgi:hypothetical protein